MLLRNAIARYLDSACIHQIRHTHTWTLTHKGFTLKLTQSNRKSLFTREIIGSNFIKSLIMLMTLRRQQVTKQGKICGFSTTVIENNAIEIFTFYESFSSRNLVPQGYSSNFNSPLYVMSHVVTQQHGIDPKLRWSRSAGQELSNEV